MFPGAGTDTIARLIAQKLGESMGALSSIVSVTAVIGPMLASPLMALVSTWPKTHWQVGLPFFASAVVLCLAAAMSVPALLRAKASS